MTPGWRRRSRSPRRPRCRRTCSARRRRLARSTAMSRTPTHRPSSSTPECRDGMHDGPELANRAEHTVVEDLQLITPDAKLRGRETSRRWQANDDPPRGRLHAKKLRSNEYNWHWANVKLDKIKFQVQGSK